MSELAALANDPDWLVSMRAMDLLEKLAHADVKQVEPFKELFIGPLADSDKWEIRLQIVRALPLFTWNRRLRDRAIAILTSNLDYPQTFVQAWALDSLATFSQSEPALAAAVQRGIARFERSPSKALQARARKIRDRLAGASGAARERRAR